MPKINLIIVLLSTVLFSCVQDSKDNGTSDADGTNLTLENKISQLELDNAMKDSLINESLAFFNEIQSNLETIGIRRDEIRTISDNPEISNDDKTWILEEIKHINFLREENANKVRRMTQQMKSNNFKIKELELMVESLIKDIQWKDEQINLLQSELNGLDKEYSALFDSYQEQAIILDALTSEINTVYYAYGTVEELSENGVINKKNGFLGIGKKTELKADLNDTYFTKIDASLTTSITIRGEGLRFVTNHPQQSYSIESDLNSSVIKITDASEFWKISRYLVVTVD